MKLKPKNHQIAPLNSVGRIAYLEASTDEVDMRINEPGGDKLALQVHNLCMKTNGRHQCCLEEEPLTSTILVTHHITRLQNSAHVIRQHMLTEMRPNAITQSMSRHAPASRKNCQGSRFGPWQRPSTAPTAASHPPSRWPHSQTEHQRAPRPPRSPVSERIWRALGTSLIADPPCPHASATPAITIRVTSFIFKQRVHE